jgi:hypothetical protein
MCKNAMVYNQKGSEVYEIARKLFDEGMAYIRELQAAL